MPVTKVEWTCGICACCGGPAGCGVAIASHLMSHLDSGAPRPCQLARPPTVCEGSVSPTRHPSETPIQVPSSLRGPLPRALRPLFTLISPRRPRVQLAPAATTTPSQRASSPQTPRRSAQPSSSCDLRRRGKPRSPCYRGDSPTPSPSPPLAHHAKQSNASRQSRRRPTGLSFAWPPTPRPASPAGGQGRGGRLLARWRDRPRRASQDAQHRGAGRESS